MAQMTERSNPFELSPTTKNNPDGWVLWEMVELDGETSNRVFDVLADWEDALKDVAHELEPPSFTPD